MAFTREPSGRRASTSGLLSSMRRPRGATIRSITWRRWGLIAESNGAGFDPSFTLDEDVSGVVDHDLGDGGVGQQGLKRAEPEDTIDHRLHQALGVRSRQDRRMVFHQTTHTRAQRLPLGNASELARFHLFFQLR